MGGITIRRALLEWAITRRGLLEGEINKKFPRFSKWIDGSVLPTLNQIEQFAKFTNTPLGLLFLESPPEEALPIPLYRTFDGKAVKPSLELLDTVQQIQLRQEWLKEQLLETNRQPLKFVGSASKESEPEKVARSIRENLKLQAKWASIQKNWTDALAYLRDAMEEAGIYVFSNGVVGNNNTRPLKVEEFRGFVLVDDIAPVVFLNGADGKAAQMFTLAHELAHVFLGSSAAFDLRELKASSDPIETACDKIAAEFLVPASEIKQIWMAVKHESNPFSSVARTFKVSELVVARRAVDLGLIDKNRFLEFYKDYMAQERKKKETASGGDFYANQNQRIGGRFGDTVLRAVRDGRILFSEAYNLTGLHGSTFEGFAKSRGYKGSSS